MDPLNGTLSVFVKTHSASGTNSVHHAELWGRRSKKYDWLSLNSTGTTAWIKHEPRPPFYGFKPQDEDLFDEYREAWSLKDAMPESSVGFVSGHDFLVVDIERDVLEDRIESFLSPAATDEEVREKLFGHLKPTKKYAKGDSRDWQLVPSRKALQNDPAWRTKIVRSVYRPFDKRWVLYHENAMSQPQTKILRHLLVRPDNPALVTTRSVEIGRGFEHVLCVTGVVQHHVVSSKEVNYVFPLYLVPPSGEATFSPDHAVELAVDRARERVRAGQLPPRDLLAETDRLKALISRLYPDTAYELWPNFDPDFLSAIEGKAGLRFLNSGGDLEHTLGPEQVFSYIYAVLHCPAYRTRYEEFLKTDYPRVPLTSNRGLFKLLSELGGRLVALHTGKASPKRMTTFPVPGRNSVAAGYPKYVHVGEVIDQETGTLSKGRVHINAAQYFEGVAPAVWDFHVGGYQVCKKWLADRRDRVLSNDELEEWEDIASKVSETIAVMEEIEAAIPSWPIR